jgi:N4-gp56 family major capsid protein
MSDAYTSTTTLSNLVQTAYDRFVRLELRSEPMFRMVANVKPVAQSMPGDSVVFNLHQDLDVVTTPLDEIVDPNSVSLKNTRTVTVTLEEYGNWTQITDLFKQFQFDNAIDAGVASRIANNLADSVDALVLAVLDSGDNNLVVGDEGALSIVANDDLATATIDGTITSQAVSAVVAKLRGASVVPFEGNSFVAFIHPDVAVDFRSDSNPGAWVYPAQYVNPTGLYAGEIGTYAGVRFIETSRAPKVTDGEGGYVYTTFVVGKEALAECVANEFGIVVDGTVVDPLKRKQTIGWKGTAGWSIFRPEALWAIKTTSSIAAIAEGSES